MSALPQLADLETAAEQVYRVMPATPQYNWPLLSRRVGAELWVKHENHTPAGAFKIRGGIVYMNALKQEQPNVTGVIAATRGNHGQSVAFAATRMGLSSTVVVPKGNSVEKNAAMQAFGAELIVHGDDFQDSLEYAVGLAEERKLHMVQSFDKRLVAGVGTYGYELFKSVPDLEAVFVPIGLGSGICGVMAARDACGSKAEIYGVVSEGSPAYALSFEQKRKVSVNSTVTIADGVDCRTPNDSALAPIFAGAADVIRVPDTLIKEAMRAYYTDTHNIAEGAGAAPLAAVMQEKAKWRGRKVGVILSGGNVDKSLYQEVLSQSTD